MKRKIKNNNYNPFIIKQKSSRFGQLTHSHRLSWTEESYIPEAGEKEIIGKTFNFARLKFVIFFAFIFFFMIIGRTAWLQVVKGDYYFWLAEGNRIRIDRIEAKRGVIYDRNGNSLVRNVANFLLYFVPADLSKDEEKRNEIIDYINLSLPEINIEEIENDLASIKEGSLESYQPLFVADNIDYEKAMQLYLKSSAWSGVIISSKTRREYNLYSTSLSHILGYTGKISQAELDEFGDEYLPIDYIGKMGVEYFWENELKGSSGKKQIEVDALGKEKKIISQQKGEDGHNLVLSIDINAQKKLEEVLLDKLVELKLSKGIAIAIDPNNGELIAMVNIPSYNNNMFARGIKSDEYSQLINHPDNPLFNRAISGEYPSGSTIKPVWAVSALEEGVVSENTLFRSVGGISIGQWFFPDWRAGGHGMVDVRRAIAESVNTFFYYIGGGYDDFKGLGVERMHEYGELFGLGSQSGIDLAGEASGFLPTREWKEETKGERWYIGDTYHMAIGQGDLSVTPLQVAMFTSVFANGGALYRPHFVRNILSSEDRLVQSMEDIPVRDNFIDEYNMHIVREGMRQTIVSGSARSLSMLPVEVAGKTGTAQWASNKETHAWFTSFAPYIDSEIVLTILIEEGGGGDVVAVPVAREFYKWYFGEYKINKNDNIES